MSDNVDNYLLHLLAVQLICDGQCTNSITLYINFLNLEKRLLLAALSGNCGTGYNGLEIGTISTNRG